jgi:hypothetical protein
VQNEQSTINALMKWLHKNGETHIDGFDFKKLPRLDKGNEAIRRATLTNDEYEALYRAMRTYTAKHNKLDDAELKGEIAIFDEACIYKRGEYWQFRMWLPKEGKFCFTAGMLKGALTKGRGEK